MAGRRNWLSPLLLPVERGFYRLAGIDPAEEQSWWLYCRSVVVFHLVGFVFLFALLRMQAVLPFNPQNMPAVPPDLAGNTSVSFLTNTNWQSYGGVEHDELSLADVWLAVQNFLSAAAGIALAMAMIREPARAGARGLGTPGRTSCA